MKKPDLQNGKRRHWILTGVRWSVSIVLIIYLIRKVDLEEFLLGIRNADLLFLGIGLSISALSILIRSYKWKMLLNVQGANFSLSYIYSLNFMSLFFNNFFLGSLGGDALRVFKTMNHSNTKSGSVSSIIVDRLTGIVTLCLVVIAAGIFILSTNRYVFMHDNIYVVIGTCTAILIFLYCVSRNIDKIRNIPWARKKFPKILARVDNIVTTVTLYKGYVYVIAASLLLSFLYQIVISVSMYFFSLSADAHLGLIHWFFIVPLVSFIIMIPVSINGIGLQEGTFFYYFNKMGIDPSTAVLVSMIPRFGMWIFSLIGGILYMFDQKGKAQPKPQCAESAER